LIKGYLMLRLTLTAVLACLTLAACGADGDPQAPQSGVSVSGDAKVGVVIK
jgi:predicted small lipoprotein YifL